ncbi:hypothetical protein ABZ468_42900 [Streptomyces sp. NPDC005708]|uniref:hypothetical protein n=1 Tax=Streptomyces sp. NPDC005708 TaxID=3154564 RepID=UPI0033EB14FC
MAVSLYKRDRGAYVRQVGSSKACGRRSCAHSPQWRVILGGWDVQAYVCTAHITWGIRLDMIAESTGKRLGWEAGYGNSPTFRTCYPTKIVPGIGPITRTDYARDVASEIGDQFPRFDSRGFNRWE